MLTHQAAASRRSLAQLLCGNRHFKVGVLNPVLQGLRYGPRPPIGKNLIEFVQFETWRVEK